MFKHLTVATLTVLLSTGAFAQTKKKSTKKKTTTKTEAPVATPEPTPVPEAAAPKHEAPVAAPAAVASNSHNVSEAYWQPSEGQSAVEVGLGYKMYTGKENTSGSTTTKTNESSLMVPLSYNYGLTADHSLGLSTTYETETVKNDPATVDQKRTGLHDLSIDSKNYSVLDGGSLLYGVSLGFSSGKAKLPNGSTEGTWSSGGMSIPLYVGYQGNTGSGYWGAVLGYVFRMEQTYDFGTDIKFKNNNSLGLNLFYEGDSEANYWLVHLGYKSTSDATTDPNVGTLKFASSIPFGFEYGWLMGNMRLAAAYDGEDFMEVDNGALAGKDKSYLAHTLSVKGRWTF